MVALGRVPASSDLVLKAKLLLSRFPMSCASFAVLLRSLDMAEATL